MYIFRDHEGIRFVIIPTPHINACQHRGVSCHARSGSSVEQLGSLASELVLWVLGLASELGVSGYAGHARDTVRLVHEAELDLAIVNPPPTWRGPHLANAQTLNQCQP